MTHSAQHLTPEQEIYMALVAPEPEPTTPTNELIALMKEYGVEARMLNWGEEPDPMSIKVADMLTEIHRLRTAAARIVAERAAPVQPPLVIPEGWQLVSIDRNPVLNNYEAYLFNPTDKPHDIFRHAPTWQEALAAAIAEAEAKS